MNVHYNYNFQFAVPWASLCYVSFRGAHIKLISFNQGSSQVDSLDLLDFVPNKYKRVLWQTPINVRTLQHILDIYPCKSDRRFQIGIKSYCKVFLLFVCLFFFQENVILKTSFCKMRLCAWKNLIKKKRLVEWQVLPL